MNRVSGLILALSLGVAISGCATSGMTGGSGGSKGSSSTRTAWDNGSTRQANKSLSMVYLRSDSTEKEMLLRQALSHAQASIAAEPENARGWLLAGQAYLQLKDYARADSMLTEAVRLHEAYTEEVDADREQAWVGAYNDAIMAYQDGDIPGAIRNLEHANLIFRKRPEAAYLLGSFYANQDEIDKAVAAYMTAIAIIRDESLLPAEDEAREQWAQTEQEIVGNLGMLLSAVDRSADAEQIYRDYLERNPDHLDSQVNLALALTRQGKMEEAAEYFSKLLTREELSDGQLMTVGIGLYNVEEFESAADAFRAATVKNPYSRDAHVNLMKALLRASVPLEEAREKKTPEADDARLTKLYQEMITVGEVALGLDPYNSEVLNYLMRSHLGLSQLLPQGPERNRHNSTLQELAKRTEELPFEVDHLSMRIGESEVSIIGSIKNLKLAEGTSVKLRFTILSRSGEVLGSEVVESTTAAAENLSEFRVVVPITGEMTGWKYERVE